LKRIFISSLVVLFALLLTGCGSKTQVLPSPTPTPTVAAAAFVCNSSQLAIILGTESAAMGARGVSGMRFKNVSSTPCTLIGFPGIQMTDAKGKSLPTFVTNSPTIMGTPVSIKIVTLMPGLTANFNMLYESATGYGNAVCPTSTQVEFKPPGAKLALVLPWKIQPYGGSTIQSLHCGEIKVSPVFLP
jgi:hypothetical protein